MTQDIIQKNAMTLRDKAQVIADSRLYGVKTPEQAFALMLFCQEKGYGPMEALESYHIVDGKPCLKATAIHARFLKSGGKINFLQYTDKCVEAELLHESAGSIKVSWDMARAGQAGLTNKDNWKKYPREMMRSRVIAEGVRALYPICLDGLHTPEEMGDEGIIDMTPVAYTQSPDAPVIEAIDGLSVEQANTIEGLLTRIPQARRAAFFKWAGVESVLDIAPQKYEAAVRALQNAIQAQERASK